MNELKGQQVKAYKKIVKFLASDETEFVLGGYAGTGKTFLSKTLATEVKGSWCFTATTNKATKVVRRSMDGVAPAKTIYSMLGVKMVAVDDRMILKYPKIPVDISCYNYVAVDEGSMLQSDILKYLRERAAACRVKLLYMADRAQLPPVGEKLSGIWKVRNQVEMTEVLRYDNEILKLATHIREQIQSYPIVDLKLISDHGNTEGVWKLRRDRFLNQIERAASKGVFSEIDHTKTIAWRNNTVNDLNKLIRSKIYGERNATKNMWIVGDRVSVKEPVQEPNSNQMIAHIDDEGTITHTSVVYHSKFPKLQCYKITIKLDEGKSIDLDVVHEASENELLNELNKLAAAAKIDPKEWRKFWALKNAFHSIRHSYAQTAHRSQGSTYKNVFVDTLDILANRSALDALKCLYVGTTRATTKVILT